VWNDVFDLSDYNSSFVELGDPYAVNIPSSELKHGNNTVKIQVGLNSFDLLGGSRYNKIIYSLVKNVSSYSPILPSADGCRWMVEYEDLTFTTFLSPMNYSGTDDCYYTSDNITFNNNDAIEYSIQELLSDLDLNQNNRVDSKFTDQDLSIQSIQIEGIPFTWETEVQARAWY
jgi:hypothetical protein